MARETLRGVKEEVDRQPAALGEFAREDFPAARTGSIFVGAGDSYAAALSAFYCSKGACLALDPYSLAATPEAAKGRDVYFVSVSGKTASNVAAAKSVRSLARRTTAITADEDSRLSASTARVIRLPLSYVPRTPGMLSFTLSLLAVLKLVTAVSCDFGRAMKYAEKDCKEIGVGTKTTYFLGNSAAYPVSIYVAAKVYEILGVKAHPELLEEFSHLQVLSLRRSDVVNVLSDLDRSGAAVRLRKALISEGFECHVIPSRGPSPAQQLFHSVFTGQLAVLRAARREGLSEPRFLRSGRRLLISDSMIY
jgi:hypothetical protein